MTLSVWRKLKQIPATTQDKGGFVTADCYWYGLSTYRSNVTTRLTSHVTGRRASFGGTSPR
jgi:hypothetical protein